MKVEELQAATKIWDLAVLDTGARGLTFSGDATYFEGLHCSARHTLEEPVIADLKEPLVIVGRTLAVSLSLLNPESKVTMKRVRGNKINISSGSRKAEVATISSSPYHPRVTDKDRKAAPHITLDRIGMIDAATFCMDVTAKDMSKPVLTGVQVAYTRKGKAIVRATNGSSRAAVTWATAKGDKMEFVVTPADLVVALGCMTDDRVDLYYTGNVIVIQDETTYVELATLSGKEQFPDLASLPTKFKRSVTIPSSFVTLIKRASDTFDTDRLCSFRLREGTVSVLTRGAERGAFQAVAAKKMKGKDIEITFDAQLLSIATHLGTHVKISFNRSDQIVLMTGDPGRYYWLSPILPRE